MIVKGRKYQLAKHPYDFEPQREEELAAAMAVPEWRLSHLYKIMIKGDDDTEGLVITFKPNDAQKALIENLHYRNIILKARQLGYTTFIAILFLDYALFSDNVRCGIIAHRREDAETIFRDKVRFAYDRLPDQLKQARPLARDSASELMFNNNSSIRVSTSMRSGTIHFLHISEFGKICAQFPARAKEVVTGSIPAVPPDGMIFIESTAEGREGAFYEMTQRAEASHNAKKKLTRKDYRFHFAPWWKAKEYQMDPDGVVITDADHDYFDEVESEMDCILTMRQRAWYIATRDSDLHGDESKMWQEYPSTPGEAFRVSQEGCYYKKELADARKEGRITSVPYDKTVPVNTFWDIGLNDEMSIWFHQRIGTQDRFIRYYENSGESFQHYVSYMQALGYVWGRHYLPHDGDTQRLGTEKNWTPRQMLEDLGLRNIEIVPRIDFVINGINMARDRFPAYWFDEVNCKEGIIHLENYRKDWNATLGVWKDTPRHDKASNGADALRQHAQGFMAESTKRKRKNRTGSWRTA
jgi:hypothetical protein